MTKIIFNEKQTYEIPQNICAQGPQNTQLVQPIFYNNYKQNVDYKMMVHYAVLLKLIKYCKSTKPQ